MCDATRLLACVEDRRRVALGAEALLGARELLPDEAWTLDLRALVASVIAQADSVLERPEFTRPRARLLVALDTLRSEIERAAARAR
jgi:hypothetical protein